MCDTRGCDMSRRGGRGEQSMSGGAEGVYEGEVEDNCGTCDNNQDNDCGQDCEGTGGGGAVEDNCETCDNNEENDCVQDCAGTWGGNEVFDDGCDCDLTQPTSSDLSVAVNGDALEDNCGTCDDHEENDCVKYC